MRYAVLLLAAAATTFGLVGCDGDATGPEPTIIAVSVTPSSVELNTDEATTITAEIQTENGVQGLSVEWSSSAPQVATVDPTGDQTAEVTGVEEGSAEIIATVTAANVDGSTTGGAEVEVQAPEPAEIDEITILDESGEPVEGEASGQIQVTVDVEPGDQAVESVSLLVDGTVVLTREVGGEESGAPPAVGSPARQGEIGPIVFDFRTDRLEGSTPDNPVTVANADLDGHVKRGQFPNGEYPIEVELTTTSGSTTIVAQSRTLTFDNGNEAFVAHLSGGQTVVEPTSGARFWGRDDIAVSITPVIFDGSGVGSVTVDAASGRQTERGGGPISIDPRERNSQPFVFDISRDENAGQVEDLPGEPDGPGGFGSDILVGEIRDGSGGVFSDDFMIEDRHDFFLDFAGPDAGPDSEILVDGEPVQEAFYTGGELSVRDISDPGVGLRDDPVVFEIEPTDDAPPIETSVFDDLPERPVGHVQPRILTFSDRVGNPGDPDAIPQAPGIGSDQTGPGIVPPPDREDGSPPLIEDNTVPLSIDDPPLDYGDGPPGSGVDVLECPDDCAHVRAMMVAGPSGAPERFLVRRPAPSLSGPYSGTITVDHDPAGHDPFIFDVGSGEDPLELDVTAENGTLDLQGSSPWVDVSGSRAEDGTATASGSGTVAGYPNTTVDFAGELTSEGTLTGDYEMGSDGGLPGGQPIVYRIDLSRDGGSQAETNGNEFVIEIPSDAPDGSYTVRVEARDRALPDGNVTSVEFDFELDRS